MIYQSFHNFSSVLTHHVPVFCHYFLISFLSLLWFYMLIFMKIFIWGWLSDFSIVYLCNESFSFSPHGFILFHCRDILLVSHRQAFAWIDHWFGELFIRDRGIEIKLLSLDDCQNSGHHCTTMTIFGEYYNWTYVIVGMIFIMVIFHQRCFKRITLLVISCALTHLIWSPIPFMIKKQVVV